MIISQTNKKQVVREELRKLMKEKIASDCSSSKRIESPLAKYDNLGQLSCIACGQKIKNELLWNSHILSRSHKEKVASLKMKNELIQSAASSSASVSATLSVTKRKATENDSVPAKLVVPVKGILKNSPANIGNQFASNSTTKQMLSGYSSSSDDEDNVNVEGPNSENLDKSAHFSSALPTDFFDKPKENVMQSVELKTVETKSSNALSELIPEGFFDDPKEDARARQVVYRDKLDDEWEQFQKAVKEATLVSEHIMEEDNELANEERNIVEVDEQLNLWSRVRQLETKKEELMKQPVEAEDTRQVDDATLEEIDVDLLMDWRAKNL